MENSLIYLRFKINNEEKYGILDKETISELTSDFFSSFKKTGKKYALSKIKLLAPCMPSKIVAVGLNYREHAKELKMPLPETPIIFLKPATSIIGPQDKIVYPKTSKRVDYEGELAVVIKNKAKNVSVSKAKDYIQGYTCFNDVTARDLQKIDGQWTRAKSFDTFAPIGPWIVDGIDCSNLKIESYLNGRLKQSSNTKDMIFGVDEIVSFVSNIMTLLPGDVIATGTPPGIASMKKGDKIEVRIEKIGSLVNSI